MKTKFDSLILAIRQKIKSCEQRLTQIESEILKCEARIEESLREFGEIEIPQNGSSLLFQQAYEEKRVRLGIIDDIKGEIAHLKNQKEMMNQECKGYYFELEKMSYLQKRELDQVLQTLKAKEQKVLDEIATMRFFKTIKKGQYEKN